MIKHQPLYYYFIMHRLLVAFRMAKSGLILERIKTKNYNVSAVYNKHEELR
ncbi:MAG: hypothetical protein ACOX16_03355 [Candidatus Izemoplasmatales bacterium]|jgi:hypothetical protein